MNQRKTQGAQNMDLRNRNMLFAPRVPLAFKPKPVELARFLIAGTTGREDYTGSHTVSPSHWPVQAQHNRKLVSPVSTPDAGSMSQHGLFFRLYIEP